MTTNIRSLGIEEWRDAVREALPPTQRNGFLGLNNSWDLFAFPQGVSLDVAVFHHTFALDDLRYSASYIRQRWPDAVILVIGEQAEQLDDPLYDDKTSSGISIEELVSMIEELVAAKRRIRRNVVSELGNA
jgi:hypothetical protein